MSYERRKVRVGKVVSDKMDKTVVVVVGWRRPHRVYKKPVRRETRFMAHDPQNACKLGDVVRIRECRPLSKLKRWRVEEILQREEIADIQPEEIIVADEPQASDEPQANDWPQTIDEPTAAAIDSKVAVEADAPPADADTPPVAETEAAPEEASAEQSGDAEADRQ